MIGFLKDLLFRENQKCMFSFSEKKTSKMPSCDFGKLPSFLAQSISSLTNCILFCEKYAFFDLFFLTKGQKEPKTQSISVIFFLWDRSIFLDMFFFSKKRLKIPSKLIQSGLLTIFYIFQFCTKFTCLLSQKEPSQNFHLFVRITFFPSFLFFSFHKKTNQSHFLIVSKAQSISSFD